jgi:hypothetical protein
VSRRGNASVRPAVVAILVLVFIAACGHGVTTTPPPTPAPQDTWYFYPLLCGPNGCPGLTNVEVDRTSTPPRVRLPVGKLTSLRAKALEGCGQTELQLNIRRWIVADPAVISIQPSSSESAIVTALATGVTRISAERVLPDGSVGIASLSDPLRLETGGCTPQPEFLFDVVP